MKHLSFARKAAYFLAPIVIVLLFCCVFFIGKVVPYDSRGRYVDVPLAWEKQGPPPFARIYLNNASSPELMMPLRESVESSGGVVEWKKDLGVAVVNNKVFVIPGKYECVFNQNRYDYVVFRKESGNARVYGRVKDPDREIARGVIKDNSMYVPSGELVKTLGLQEAGLKSDDSFPQVTAAFWPPVSGPVSSPYGTRNSVFGGSDTQFHNGIDLAAESGAPVLSVSSGIVKTGYDEEGWGNYAIIRDGEYEYHYYHMSGLEVKNGSRVEPGQVIGYVGSTGSSTGPHLHFGVKRSFDPETINIL